MSSLTSSRYCFPKAERLVSEIKIQSLFATGAGFLVYPLRVVVLESEESCLPPVQVLTSVTKRRYRHAVDRNRVKRWIREAYRLQKAPLIASVGEGRQYHIAFIFVGKEDPSFESLSKAMEKALVRLTKRINPEV